MKNRTFIKTAFLALIMLYLINCTAPKTAPRIEKLFVGLSSYEVFKRDITNHLDSIAPPPFDSKIAPNNLIEDKNGAVFYYSFAVKKPLCGYMLQDKSTSYEYYYLELDTLQHKYLRQINEQNWLDFCSEIIDKKQPIFLSIGINNDSSNNIVLLKITNELYQHAINIVWKIRAIDPKEEMLLNKIKMGTKRI